MHRQITTFQLFAPHLRIQPKNKITKTGKAFYGKDILCTCSSSILSKKFCFLSLPSILYRQAVTHLLHTTNFKLPPRHEATITLLGSYEFFPVYKVIAATIINKLVATQISQLNTPRIFGSSSKHNNRGQSSTCTSLIFQPSSKIQEKTRSQYFTAHRGGLQQRELTCPSFTSPLLGLQRT